MNLAQVFLVALWGSLDALITGVPVSRANLAVLVGELEGIDEAKGLVNTAADWQVVDCDLLWIVSLWPYPMATVSSLRNIPVAQCHWDQSRTILAAQCLPPQ